jgi:hypothetical protein
MTKEKKKAIKYTDEYDRSKKGSTHKGNGESSEHQF